MQRFACLAAVAAAAVFANPAFAHADDWVALKLRGAVSELVGDQWQPVKRGDAVPDGRLIRTGANGAAQFARGAETVDLMPNTQVQIFDKGGAKPYTTVRQYFGTLAVEAEVENVQHFAVETPYLAAVVKGTKFRVKSGKTGAAVSVQRGHVAVEDKKDGSHVTLSVGQQAAIGPAGTIAVSGAGTLPVVVSADGQPLAVESYSDLLAAEKLAEQQAKLLKTPEAKAAAAAAKQAADVAKKAAQSEAKADKKAEQAAEKSAKDADKSNAADSSNKGSSDGSGKSEAGAGNSNGGSDGGGNGKSDGGGSDKGKGKKD